MALEVVRCAGAAEVFDFVGDPVVFFFHLGHGLDGALLFFVELFDLVAELLLLKTFFGDAGGFRAGGFFEGAEFVVEAC